jgi:hypothetical protein
MFDTTLDPDPLEGTEEAVRKESVVGWLADERADTVWFQLHADREEALERLSIVDDGSGRVECCRPSLSSSSFHETPPGPLSVLWILCCEIGPQPVDGD